MRNNQMQIICETIAELVKVCAGLVAMGITFEAHTSDLTITCTGGF
jgi:hypothetical protein